jgi:hypothetical protein
LAIVFILIISLAILGPILYLEISRIIPAALLTRDLSSVAGVPFYYGILSQLGIFFWAGTIVACFLGYARKSRNKSKVQLKWFLFFSGLFTSMLGFDDLFVLHEIVFPEYLGIPEAAVLGVYGISLLLILGKFYAEILKTNFIFLLISFFFLGMSVLTDVFHIPGLSSYFAEDGLKFIGIINWFVYFFSTSVKVVSKGKLKPQIEFD